jgi:hypothetical protein
MPVQAPEFYIGDSSAHASRVTLTASHITLTDGARTQTIPMNDLMQMWPTLRHIATELRDKSARRIQKWWTQERHAPPSAERPCGGPEYRKWFREIKRMGAVDPHGK